MCLQLSDGDCCGDGGLNPLHLTLRSQKVAGYAGFEVELKEGVEAGAGGSDLPDEVTTKGGQDTAWEWLSHWVWLLGLVLLPALEAQLPLQPMTVM